MFPAWHLGHNPDHEIIACSYNVSLAMSFSRKVKEVFNDPAYQSVFQTRLHPDFQANEEWGILGTRGGYVAAGVGGGITGKGAHVLLIDDPIKNAEEADSAETREKLWDWYGSTAYTRLAPGGGVLVIQTWWHDDDLAGKLQQAMALDEEADQFEIVKYPAIAEADEWLDPVTDEIVRITHSEVVAPNLFHEELPAFARAAKMGIDVVTRSLKFLRAKGGALHPQRYDERKLHSIKKTIPARFWAALYQQNPVPDDGAYFTKEQFRQAGLPSLRRANVYVAFDFAISEKKQNDYTVGVVGLQDENDVLHVAEVMRFKSGDGMFIVESILNLCQKWYSPNLILGFEDGQIFRAIESLLKKRMRERKFYPSTQLLKPITDKMARARPLQGRMQQGMVSFAEAAQWYDTARAEMLRFPAGVHDDQVDALAWMATMAVGREAPRQQQAKAPKSWKDKLKTLGGTVSHMVA
jgi:predicted phage terminase large subunit-like protein